MALRKFLILRSCRRRRLEGRTDADPIHSRAPELVYELTQFGEQYQGLRCFGLVDTAHSEPDMHEHPIADAGLDWVSFIDNRRDGFPAAHRRHRRTIAGPRRACAMARVVRSACCRWGGSTMRRIGRAPEGDPNDLWRCDSRARLTQK